jgi:hypothetical protein
MKFLPIIHNMHPTDPAYEAAQAYNAIIGARPGKTDTLAGKIEALRNWQADCSRAMDEFKQLINA